MKRVDLYNAENRFSGTDVDQEVMKRFVLTRCIRKKDRRVIMPMIELLKHAPSAKPYDMSDEGIAVTGMHDGEVLVKYSNADLMQRMIPYGFNAPKPFGFSLSFQIQHRDRQVVVQGGNSPNPMQPCEIELKKERVMLKQPLIASASSPKMPRTLLIKSCRSLEGIDAHELFDQINQRNTMVLFRMLRELENVEGDVAQLLRTGCLDQLAALSHHYGQRDDLLAADAPVAQAA